MAKKIKVKSEDLETGADDSPCCLGLRDLGVFAGDRERERFSPREEERLLLYSDPIPPVSDDADGDEDPLE